MKPLGVKKPLRNFEPSNPGSHKKLKPSFPTFVFLYKKECNDGHWTYKGDGVQYLTQISHFFRFDIDLDVNIKIYTQLYSNNIK